MGAGGVCGLAGVELPLMVVVLGGRLHTGLAVSCVSLKSQAEYRMVLVSIPSTSFSLETLIRLNRRINNANGRLIFANQLNFGDDAICVSGFSH